MKKNYFLSITLILLVGLTGFSQTSNFNFNDDNGGWLASNDTELSDPVSGSSKIVLSKHATAVPTGTGYDRTHPDNQFYHPASNLDTSVGKFLNIKLSNNTINTRIVLFMPVGNVNIPIVASNAAFTTYTYDMTDAPGWTGNLGKLTMRFRLHDYDATKSRDYNTEAATGHVLIDDISVTAESPTASVNDVNFKDDASISVYPNPANDVISIKSGRNINKIEVYNILGQLRNVATKDVNSMNISSLSKGVYILKIYQNDGGLVSTKRFVKN